MAKVDARARVPLDVMVHTGVIEPALKRLIVIDQPHWKEHEFSSATMARRRQGRKGTVMRRDLLPLWGELDSETLLAGPLQGYSSSGKSIKGRSVLAESVDASLSGGVIFASSNILRSARNPQVSDELLVGAFVLGRAVRGANPPEFTASHFESLIAMADGIRNTNSGMVRRSLREIDKLLDKDMSYSSFGRARANDEYEGFGKMAETARVVDRWIIPAIQSQETAGVDVINSVIYGTVDVFPSVLGGIVEHSIIGTPVDVPFDNAHILVKDSVLVGKRNKRKEIEGTVRYGHPEEAKDVVQAFAELGSTPLARLAA